MFASGLFSVGGENLENTDSSNGNANSQLKFNDNSIWHKVSVIKSGYETILVVDRTRSSTHRSDITSNDRGGGTNGKIWRRRRLNVPESIGVDKVGCFKNVIKFSLIQTDSNSFCIHIVLILQKRNFSY